MKKLIYTMLAAVAMTACADNYEADFNPTAPTTPDAPSSSTKVECFTATIGDATRVDMGDKTDAGYPLTWSEGDQITVTDGTSTGVYALESVNDSGAGRFVYESGDAVAADAEQYTAWCGEDASYESGTFSYTIPAEQTHVEGSKLGGKLPLFAQSTDTNLSFRTPASIVRFNFTKDEAIGLTSIQIVGAWEDAPKSGTFSTTIGANGEFGATTVKTPSMAKGNVEYTLNNVEVGPNVKSFYIILPAWEHKRYYSGTRFDIQVTYSDGCVDYFKQTADVITTKPGVVLPISLKLRKVARMNVGAYFSGCTVKNATSITFKAKSTADLTGLEDVNYYYPNPSLSALDEIVITKDSYPAYVEWTDANKTTAIIHTEADMFLGVSRKDNYSNRKLQWFKDWTKIKSIDFGDDFDTSGGCNMSQMFYGCTALETITFGKKFTTKNLQYMVQMFGNCYCLKELDLTGFDFSSVNPSTAENYIGYMFDNVGKNSANKPINIYLSAKGYEQLTALKAAGKSLGAGEGTYWQLVNVDAVAEE